MSLNIVKSEGIGALEPLTCRRDLSGLCVAGKTLLEQITSKWTEFHSLSSMLPGCSDNFWPSSKLLRVLSADNQPTIVLDNDQKPVAWISVDGAFPEGAGTVVLDSESILIKYPWDVLALNERLVGDLTENKIDGEIRENVVIDGKIIIGEGSVLLPGVYIEGNAIIGANCKIGPNCYIRGNTFIGDSCHIGQAVEVKNSILMEKVGAGHLSYLGDSILCPFVNLGAGTITANFRHDGKNHRSMVDGELLDTGRRKLGAIIGDHVHTGIHTSIYPGRKIWPDQSTLPGAVVQKDLR